MPNRFNLRLNILCKCFNKESNHNLNIDIDGNTILSKNLDFGKIHTIKIDEFYDFKHSKIVKINFQWTGDKESADKYLKLWNIYVNDQLIPTYSLHYYPIENEYIKKLKSTPKGLATYKNKILKPGQNYGWYGKLMIEFKLGNTLELKKLAYNNAYNIMGIPSKDIFTDSNPYNQFVADRKTND